VRERDHECTSADGGKITPEWGAAGALEELQLRLAFVARARFGRHTVKKLQRELGISQSQAKDVLAGRAPAKVAVEMLRRWSPRAWNDALAEKIMTVERDVACDESIRGHPDYRRALQLLESAKAHQADAARLLGSTYDAC